MTLRYWKRNIPPSKCLTCGIVCGASASSRSIHRECLVWFVFRHHASPNPHSAV
jgi:hypothetical protein